MTHTEEIKQEIIVLQTKLQDLHSQEAEIIERLITLSNEWKEGVRG